MRSLAWVLGVGVAVATPGCAQLFGIDQTSGGDAGVDAYGGSTLAFDRYSVGATIVQAPLPVDGLAAPTFFVGDAQVPGVVSAPNAWQSDQRASAVLFHLPDYPASIPRMFAFPSPSVHGLFGILEHPAPQPASTTAQISLALSLPTPAAAGESFQLYIVGAWSVLGLAPEVAAASISQANLYTTYSSLTGRPLEAITAGDAVLALRYTGAQLTAALDAPGFAQADATDQVTGGLTALALDKTLNVALTPADAATRLAAAAPPSPAAAVFNWALTAAPGFAIASNAGPQLHAGGLLATDTTLAVTYANPFAATHNWHTVFTNVAHLDRSYTPAAGALAGKAIGLVTQVHTLREPGDGTAADSPTFDAGLPTMVTLGATPLTTDGLQVADDPTTPLVVTFVADKPDNTLYQVQVLESALAMDGTTLTLHNIFSYTGVAPTLTLPANTLVAGHTYRLRAVCIAGGYPALASGDLTQRDLPLSVGLLDSGVFTVGAPL